MWLKQCHKPPMTGNGKHTTYKNDEIGDGLLLSYQHYTHNIGSFWLNHRYWTEQSPPEMMSWRASSQQYIHDCQFLWSQYMVCHINPHGDPGSLVFTSLFFNWLNNFNHQHVSTVNRRLTRVWPFRLLRSTEKKTYEVFPREIPSGYVKIAIEHGHL